MKNYNLINQRATTCKHGGHCEWIACDKCSHYEPDVLNQQPCEDCISRQEAINCVTSNEFRYKIVEDIKTLPSVTPKEKTGRWIIKDGKEQGYDIAGVKTWYIQIMCDKCGFIKPTIEGHTGQYHFCPNCGARMIEIQESEVQK